MIKHNAGGVTKRMAVAMMAPRESSDGEVFVAVSVNLPAYLERIGFAGSIAPTLETLSLLHQQHPAAIAFENKAYV